jgi:hypothetical protein
MAINTKFAKQSFLGLPPWAKGVVAIAIVAGVGYGVYYLVKTLKDLNENKDDKEEQKSWEDDAEAIKNDPKRRQVLTDAQLKSMANKVFSAMDGYGTDEEAIISVFRTLKTDGDFIGLQKAWGIREVNSGAFNPTPNFKGTLNGAVTDELSGYYKQRINKILTNKKIKYRV